MAVLGIGQGVTSSIRTTGSTLTTVASAVGTAGRLAAALSNVNTASGIGSAIRSLNLPVAGEAVLDVMNAFATFEGDANENDWRVRLSLPKWPSFRNSPVLQPLVQAGGLIFPYTPQIQISTNTRYDSVEVTHSNYKFNAYQSSDPGTIMIQGAPIPVEDESQALYWIATLHYLRSVTKMFSGYDPKAGNPPPIVYFNAYGNYVFKNIPVAVSQFSVTLDKDCDYISCNVVGSATDDIEGLSSSINQIGRLLPGLNKIANTVNTIVGGVGQVNGVLRNLDTETISGGISYVPTKSFFNVTLTPMYSRNSVRNFSLDRFVSGGYLTSSPGFI